MTVEAASNSIGGNSWPCRAIGAVLISSLLFFTVEKPAITLREGVLVDFYEGLICDAFLQGVVPVNYKKKVKIGRMFFLSYVFFGGFLFSN